MFSIALAALLLQVTVMPSQHTASGNFDVSVKPNSTVTGPVGVLSLDKTYHGDLEATATGQMLGTGDTSGKGAASYVALEQVTGTLAGKTGGFVLQHSGWMTPGKQVMTVTIAPGSGTGELSGINGTLDIVIEGGKHDYVLHYSLSGRD